MATSYHKIPPLGKNRPELSWLRPVFFCLILRSGQNFAIEDILLENPENFAILYLYRKEESLC